MDEGLFHHREKELKDITSFLAEGIYVLNEKGQITFMNPEAERLLGWTAIELANKNAHDIIHCHKLDGAPLSLEQCPMRNVIETGKPYYSTDDLFTRKDGKTFPISVLTSPIMDNGKIVASVTAFRDITELKSEEDALRKAHEELEEKVKERTIDLAKLNEELKIKSRNLEELNTALKVLLRQREEDKNELEERVLSNVNELILPFIEKLKKCRLDSRGESYLHLVESNLLQIISPFSMRLSSKYHNLTHTEIEVANFIREGKTSKELAELFHITKDTVDAHRKNIRKKLGLTKIKTNLRSYLLSLN
jgi:PAS domain S-box-containing protein